MEDIKNNSLCESGNADPVTRDEVTEDNDNENTGRMQLWTYNYIIVRMIMSHLDWRERLRCAAVCRLWRDAIESLQRENLRCYDFTVQLCRHKGRRNKFKLEVSSLPVLTQPMFAIGFYNFFAERSIRCEDFTPGTCHPPCAAEHDMIESMHEIMLSKLSCLLLMYDFRLIYMPQPASRTYRYGIHDMPKPSVPLLAGLYLPKIPNVNYRTLQYRTELTVQKDFYSVVDDICATDIIKGVVVFVDHEFPADVEDLRFLYYFKDKQPNIPFALGGRGVEMANRGTGIERDAPVVIGVFSVPREPEPVPGPSCQFNMYSLLIDDTVQERAAIEKVIQTFAENISELEFSAALKLSCTQRRRLHSVEQELFRATFPRTTVLGCYGNGGEIGHSHPHINPQSVNPNELDVIYYTSTVFVYFGWGK